MAYVHVILSGIVSLIPDANNPPKSWTIRLHDERGNHDHPHVPSIVVEDDNVLSEREPDCTEELPDGTLLDAWLLDNGLIKVNSSIISSAISSPRLLAYVLPIEGGCGGVSNCPIAKPFPGVRLPVDRGSLEATEFEVDQWEWVVTPGLPGWVAEEVCWHFEIDGTELEIELPYRNTPLTLNISAPDGGQPGQGGDIELRLQNTMRKDVFPIIGAEPKPDPDPHVHLYFDEASANPSQTPVLRKHPPIGNKPPLPSHNHRMTDSKIGTKFHGLRVNCPPALWKG